MTAKIQGLKHFWKHCLWLQKTKNNSIISQQRWLIIWVCSPFTQRLGASLSVIWRALCEGEVRKARCRTECAVQTLVGEPGTSGMQGLSLRRIHQPLATVIVSEEVNSGTEFRCERKACFHQSLYCLNSSGVKTVQPENNATGQYADLTFKRT